MVPAKSAEQPLVLLMAVIAAPLLDRQAGATPTWLLRTRVPDVTVAELLVDALKVAKVPLAVAAVTAPTTSIPTRNLLTLFTSTDFLPGLEFGV